MSEEKGLSKDKQFINLLLGAFYYVLCLVAIVWILLMWWHQWQKAKREGRRFVPQWPRSITFLSTGYSMNGVTGLLRQYHVYSFPFVLGWIEHEGGELLECNVLVPATQFDYADAILHQHGVSVISEPGTKRGYTMHQPRDYGERRPAQRPQNKAAKLGKTYR